jgi:hypothetical protein
MSTEHAHPHHGHHHHKDVAAEAPAPATEVVASTETPVAAEAPVSESPAVQQEPNTPDAGQAEPGEPQAPENDGLLMDGAPAQDAAAPTTGDAEDAPLEDDTVPPPAWPDTVVTSEDKIEHLYARLVNLEGMVGSIANNGNKMAMQFNQVQGAMKQIGQMLGQLTGKVNSMDPKRPILEVTLCQYEPTLDPEAKQIAFKATFHGPTHPERPNTIDALRLDMSDPQAPHWVPIGVSPGLAGYIKSKFDAAEIAQETWLWVRLIEKQRPTGETADFADGVDDTTPPPENEGLSVEAADAVSTFANGEQPDPGVEEALGVAANDTTEA